MTDESTRDPLRAALEEIQHQHPKLEELLQEYRERRRVYDTVFPRSPQAEPGPTWRSDGQHRV